MSGVGGRVVARTAPGLVAALLASACCCSPVVFDEPPNECSFDVDCRADDPSFCDGTFACSHGLFGGSSCQPAGVPCLAPSVFCDEEEDRCVPCAERPGHPGCPSVPDGGPFGSCSVGSGSGTPGSACVVARNCLGAPCRESVTLGASLLNEDGSVARTAVLELFGQGACGAACDGADPGGCGECGVCTTTLPALGSRIPFAAVSDIDGVCRTRCVASDDDPGCARQGYACDPETLACVDRCTSDAACQALYVVEDGVGRFLDLGDESGGYCDALTGRCRTHGRPDAQFGDPCTRDGQCMEDGACLRPNDGRDGYCTRAACRHDPALCPADWGCDQRGLGPERSACRPACRVGQEYGTPAALGVDGGSPDCGVGLSCVWHGGGTEVPDGVCQPGRYTAVLEPNIGASCTSDAQCWSPLGYGYCAYLDLDTVDSGICTIAHCALTPPEAEASGGVLPGLDATGSICDMSRGEICVRVSGSPLQTQCAITCTAADECAPGYACAPDEITHVCQPTCRADAHCREGARCGSLDGGPCAGEEPCYCSDRTPRAE